MKSKSIKRWILLAVLISITVIQSTSVLASGTDENYSLPDTNRNLSLTIETWGLHNGRRAEPVSGLKSEVYMVADLCVKSGTVEYIVKEPYSKVKHSLEGLTASESLKIADDYSKIVKNPCYSTISDKNGTACIEDMKPGMYLVIPGSTKEREFAPYLISVPNYENIDGGKWIYDVKTLPKSERETIPKKPASPKRVNVKTGDNENAEFYTLIIGLMGIGIAGIIIIKRRDEKE